MISQVYQCVVLMSLASVSGSMLRAQDSNQEVTLTRAAAKRLVASAHSSAEFNRLANYFEGQSNRYELKAEQDQKELDLLHGQFFHAKSYAMQEENTRNRLAHDRAEAKRCDEEAATYRKRAKDEPVGTIRAGTDK